MRMCNTILILGLAILPADGPADATLYHGFHHVDVVQQQVVPDSWLIVDDGMIVSMGHGTTPTEFTGARRDMSDTWALPGLIDGHAHITAGPHKVAIVDGQPLVTIESVDTITRYNALMALAFGVTTVRNPGGDAEANARYDHRVASGAWLGPSALHAGAVIQPPPFGGKAFAYPTTRDAWFAEAERQADLGMTYFKLYTSLTPDELALGIEAAHAHGLQAIAHLDSVSWQTALDLGIDGLEHALPTSADLLPVSQREAFERKRLEGSKYLTDWFARVDFDGPEMQHLFATLAERRTTLNLTLIVNDLVTYADDLSVVIDDDDAGYLHPDNWASMSQFLQLGAANWTGEDFAMARAARPKVLEFARRLHEAGVPMLVGTDGNGGGPLMAVEMRQHVEAGIEPFAVLALATVQSAQTLGLEQVGRLAPGQQADVVFLAANPVTRIESVREVVAVLVDGTLHTHAALVARARALLSE